MAVRTIKGSEISFQIGDCEPLTGDEINELGGAAFTVGVDFSAGPDFEEVVRGYKIGEAGRYRKRGRLMQAVGAVRFALDYSPNRGPVFGHVQLHRQMPSRFSLSETIDAVREATRLGLITFRPHSGWVWT